VASALLAQRKPQEAQRQLEGLPDDSAPVNMIRTQIAGLSGDKAKTSAFRQKTLAALEAGSTDADWWIWRSLGRVAYGMGDRQSGIAHMARARAALPSHFGVLGEYGEWLVAAGQTEAAREVLEDLRKRSPNYFRTALLDALIKVDEEKLDEAYQQAVRVLASVPDNVTANLIAANIDLSRGAVATARGRLTTLLQRAPAQPGALRLLASIEQQAGQVELAESLLGKALSLDPGNTDLLADRAEQLVARGRLDGGFEVGR
jgi:predicted Zn-dependent protease